MTIDSLSRRTSDENLSSVVELALKGNEKAGRIRTLDNLSALKSLRKLDVSNNALTSLTALGASNAPALTSLDVSGNRISSLDGLKRLSESLKILHLTSNAIGKLPKWMGSMIKLEDLGLAHNLLSARDELRCLRSLPQLTALELAGNPLAKLPQARLYAIHACPSLHRLDSESVRIEEVREAAERFDRDAMDALQAQVDALEARERAALDKLAALGDELEHERKLRLAETGALRLAEARVGEGERALVDERIRTAAVEKRLHECQAQLLASREGVYATLLGADCFEATGFEPWGSADDANKSADHEESEELTGSATATECQAPSPGVAPSLSAMEKAECENAHGDAASTGEASRRRNRARIGSMAEGPDSSSCVSEHDDGGELKTAARRLTWDHNGSPVKAPAGDDVRTGDDDVEEITSTPHDARDDSATQLECLVLQLQNEVNSLRANAMASDERARAAELALEEAAAAAAKQQLECEQQELEREAREQSQMLVSGVGVGFLMDGRAAAEETEWLKEESDEVEAAEADAADDEAERAAEAVVTAALAAVEAAEAAEVTARAEGAAERWVLLKALRDADAERAGLEKSFHRLEASAEQKVSIANGECLEARRRSDSAAAAQAARIEELVCQCELSKCMLASKEDQLKALRLLLDGRSF